MSDRISCDISPIYEGWTDIVGKSVIRGFMAPGSASARGL
jgi:hypothetical protein